MPLFQHKFFTENQASQLGLPTRMCYTFCQARHGHHNSTLVYVYAPPRWLSGEHIRLMTWWLYVRSPVEVNFLSGIFSPLASAEACEKSSRWLSKEKLCYYWCEKARKHMFVTIHHDMTLAVKVALNHNTTNQPIIGASIWTFVCPDLYGPYHFKKNVHISSS